MNKTYQVIRNDYDGRYEYDTHIIKTFATRAGAEMYIKDAVKTVKEVTGDCDLNLTVNEVEVINA